MLAKNTGAETFQVLSIRYPRKGFLRSDFYERYRKL
nr:MAG TPA: hypothetical protein [Caudoviricetes sp.]